MARVRGVDRALDGGGVEIERDGINLSEDRRRAHLKHGVGHGHESKRGNDDFVALAHSERKQREMQTRSAGTDGDSVIDAVIGRQLRFKCGELRTKAEMRRAQNSSDGSDLCLGNVGRGEWNARGHCRSARSGSANLAAAPAA